MQPAAALFFVNAHTPGTNISVDLRSPGIATAECVHGPAPRAPMDSRRELQSLIAGAESLAAERRYEEAFHGFSSALTIMPRSAELLHNSASVMDAIGKSSEAVERWQYTLRIHPSFSPARRALEAHADGAEAAALRHVGDGDTLRAAAAWRAAARASPASREGLHSGLGDALLSLGRNDEARRSHARALEINPRHGPAYLGLGEIALQRSSIASAVQFLRHGVALLPKSSIAWLLLGAAQGDADGAAGQGDGATTLDDAVASLRTATRLAPRDANGYWQLGDVLAARGERRLSVRSLTVATRLQPTHIQAYSSLARVLSYEAYSPTATDLASWAFRHALRAAPNHLETWHNLGEYLHARGEPARAVVAFARATAVGPASGPSHLSLGESLQRLCRVDEAGAHYSRAASLMPHSSRAQVHALMPATADGEMGGVGVVRSVGDGSGDARWRDPADEASRGGSRPRRAVALPSLASLRVEPAGAGWQDRAAAILQEHGVVVVSRLLAQADTDALLRQIQAWPTDAEGTSHTTRQPRHRRHQALPLQGNASGHAARALVSSLGSVLADALGTLDPRVVECGFLTSEHGAQAQAVHADTSPPHLLACEARALKVQLALVHVSQDMGAFEVIPGTHHSSAPGLAANSDSSGSGEPATAMEAEEVLALPILVGPGDVTLYWASVQHRGGANAAMRSRPTFHIALIGEGGAPTGMPYTVLVDDLLAMYPSTSSPTA